MTTEQLAKANEIHAEIKRIDNFLLYAERVWTGKLVKETSRYVFKSSAYGVVSSKEYELDTETKNEMLDVLRRKKARLQRELEEL